MPALPKKYLTPNMDMLKQALAEDSTDLMHKLVYERDILDPEEALMVIFACVAAMNKPVMFEFLVKKHNYFKMKPVWHALFSMKNIFVNMQNFTSHAERCKLDELVLQVALERDLVFLTEVLLERAVVTPELISLLLKDGQQLQVINLLRRPIKPKFLTF
jgi:hypothetical protein